MTDSKENVLTGDAVRRWVSVARGVPDVDCRKVTPEAVAYLASLPDRERFLDYVCSSLEHLPIEVAEILVDAGRGCCFPNLRELDPEVARLLVSDQGCRARARRDDLPIPVADHLAKQRAKLIVGCRESLSKEAAGELAKFEGSLLLGVRHGLTADVAAALVGVQDALSLNELQTLGVGAAKALSQFRGWLNLGVSEVPNAVARALATPQGPSIVDRREHKLPIGVADVLRGSKRSIHFGIVPEMAADALLNLSRVQGDVSIRWLGRITGLEQAIAVDGEVDRVAEWVQRNQLDRIYADMISRSAVAV